MNIPFFLTKKRGLYSFIRYILDNKTGKSVLSKIKDFIVKNGCPDKILTDNGGEFINKDLKKYCKKKELN